MLDAQHMYAEWISTCGGPSTALADVPSCFPTGTLLPYLFCCMILSLLLVVWLELLDHASFKLEEQSTTMLIKKFTCMGVEVGRIRLEVGEEKP